MEQRVNDPAETAADHERDVRALSTLIRTFERMLDLDRTARSDDAAATEPHGPRGPGGGPAASADAAGAADAERLRRQIAERVERLVGRGDAAGDTP
jgi:hypothetical protein